MSIGQTLRAALPSLARFRGSVGSEQEMSFNRLIFALVFLIYLSAMRQDVDALAFVNLGIWSLFSVLVFLHIRVAEASHQGLRRGLAMVSDMGFLTWFLHIGGAAAAPFFPVYLWVALGNGFRFGRRWLVASMGVFVAGFGWVALTTPYWQGHGYLAAGLLLGPCVLGLYASALIHKLSHARRQAEQANQAKSLFLASVSHDLRTPLHAIIGTGSLLRSTRLDDEQREMTRTIDDAAQTLLSRISGIIEHCRLEAGDLKPRPEQFMLGGLLAEVRRLLSVQARDKGLSLTIQIAPGTPLQIVCDRAYLRDVLLNLVGNAVKFTEAGGVVVAVRDDTRGTGPAMLRFEVVDTGIGIDKAAAARIFEEFVQADASIMNRYGGTGLGLAICRRLVRLMQGEIGVASTPGLGSAFWFTIRARRPDPADAAPDLSRLALTILSAGPAPDPALLGRISDCGAGVEVERIAPDALAGLCGLSVAEAPEHVLVCGRPSRLGWRDLVRADPEAAPDAVLIALAADPGLAGLAPWRRRRLQAVLPLLPGPDALRSALLHASAVLPDLSPPGDGEPGEQPSGPMPGLIGGTPCRILLAEDNAVNRRVVQRLLERSGFVVETACDGEEALDRLEAGGIDVALMDVNMPVMDGVEATRLYRFIALGAPRVPIIGLTADATPETAQRCLTAGMDQVVTKPVGEAQLLRAILACRPATPASPAAGPASLDRPETEMPGLDRTVQQTPVLDPEVLGRLVELGGGAFLAEVAADFEIDAAQGLQALGAALEGGDAAGFRAAAHGLRSSAASVGAIRLAGLAAAAEAMRTDCFATEAPRHLPPLQAAVAEVRGLLTQPIGATPPPDPLSAMGVDRTGRLRPS